MDPSDFVCLNCNKVIEYPVKPILYCSPNCKQEAELIRYARSCIKDGRIHAQDVREAITIKMAHILNGGYNSQERYVSEELREHVHQHFNGVCCQCGEPGTDVDHIAGPSNDVDNLQLLCRSCHNKKTLLRVQPVCRDNDDYDRLLQRRTLIDARIEAEEPIQICDNDVNWNEDWRSIRAARKSFLNQRTTSSAK